MERKTKVHAEDNRQELTITREFDLPVAALFRAHTDAAIVAQWMDNTVLKLEATPHGSYAIEKKDEAGNILFKANGTFHSVEQDRRIVRTFEMENAPFDVQMEFLEFEGLSDTTSKLTMQIVYRSVALRDQMLKMPFEYGLNMAHNRLEEILNQKN